MLSVFVLLVVNLVCLHVVSLHICFSMDNNYYYYYYYFVIRVDSMVDKTVIFEVHYGGELTRHPTWKYLGGELDVIDPIDEDLVFFFDIEDILKVYGMLRQRM
jgi:hypothetical protein